MNNTVLKNKIKEDRNKKNITQKELAEMTGTSRQTINALETGKYCPTAKLAWILCMVLEVKFEDLFWVE